MTKHFNVGEAKTNLSQLIASAVRGEDIVIDHDGKPKVRLVPVDEVASETRKRRAEKRASAFGMWREAFSQWRGADIGPSMTDEEVEVRWHRKFGPAA